MFLHRDRIQMNYREINIILLAKHNAAVTPKKPKNGADVGQVSYDTVAILYNKLIYEGNSD